MRCTHIIEHKLAAGPHTVASDILRVDIDSRILPGGIARGLRLSVRRLAHALDLIIIWDGWAGAINCKGAHRVGRRPRT